MVSRRLLVALTLLLTGSCEQDPKPLTQLVLVSDTNIADVDTVQFLIESEDGTRTEMARVARTGDAVAYVNVVRDEGTLGPLVVAALGFHGEALRMRRVHRVSFLVDETRVVKLHLPASCIGKLCAATETCDESGCVPIDLPSQELDKWNGSPPRLAGNEPDAGVPPLDGGAKDAAADAARDGGDAQTVRDASTDGAATDAEAPDADVTDGATDAAIDPNLTQCDGGQYNLNSDPYHCGTSCSTAIKCDDGFYVNTIKVCTRGVCNTCFGTLCGSFDLACKPGYSNCVSDLTSPGCETANAENDNNCGACGAICGVGRECNAGVCVAK